MSKIEITDANTRAVAHQLRMVDALRRFADAIDELDELPQCEWHVDISLVVRRGESDAHTNGELATFVGDLATAVGLSTEPRLSTAAYPDAMYITRELTPAGKHEIVLFPRVSGVTIRVDPNV